MDLRQFLLLVVPSTGILFTATPADAGWSNVAHESLDSAIAHINTLTFEHQAAYFAVASYDKARYWDADKHRWRQRTQVNAQALKAFFLDLDVEPDNPLKFASKAQALAELRAFVKKIGLPRPMIVDSGGGIHVYWPLTAEVPARLWHPVAEQFKAICVHEHFQADRSLTSDHARVLRALGSYNTRRHATVTLLAEARAAVSFTDFAARIEAYASQHGVAASAKGVSSGAPLAGAPAGAWSGEDNLGATNEPLNFDRIAFHCAQMGTQVATRGAGVAEPLWRAGLGIVKFCDQQTLAAQAISDAHADFNLPATAAKLAHWNAGPTTCQHFHELQPQLCEACPHWSTLTSPAQLGRVVAHVAAPQVTLTFDAAPPVTIDIPDPPVGYSRRPDGTIVRELENADGRPIYALVCPYDLYPLMIRSQNDLDADVDESSRWRVLLPFVKGQPPAPRDFNVPLSLIPDARGLIKLLGSKGLILTGEQAKMTQHYMSAYLQKLAKDAGRDKLYERLGWHEEHAAFVLGDRILHRDGKVLPHSAGEAIQSATKHGLKSAGTLADWQAALRFYNHPGYEGHRFFIYASFASPLFHMNDTGNHGAVLCAGGASGRGKTTCLKACSSVWGAPPALLVNGNREGATTNALYATMGTYHSLPFLLDDVTERETDELRRLFLNITQGEGKRRMLSDGSITQHIDTWSLLVLLSTNLDTISAIMGSGRDVDPHLMRIIAVDFGLIDTGAEAKIAADHFIRALGTNYGHAGPIFMGHIVREYEAVKRLYIHNIEKVDRLRASTNASAERYWSAVVAACYTAAQIAAKVGLLDYPYESDLQWMLAHLSQQRETIKESRATPQEMLNGFLNAYLRSTLIVSVKAASNLDNIAHKPTDELLVRVELDADRIYIARNAVMEYCASSHTAFRALEWQLEHEGVIAKRDAQKVLGADTIYSNGQTRCWLIDATKFDGYRQMHAQFQTAYTPPANVVPIQGGRKA
jgi:hypothetical protein